MWFFFKQNTAYEMRNSDWSSDVCSSDLRMGVTVLWTSVFAVVLLMFAPDHIAGVARDPVIAAMAVLLLALGVRQSRSEERRVGKECDCTCSSRWSPYHQKKKRRSTQSTPHVHTHTHLTLLSTI